MEKEAKSDTSPPRHATMIHVGRNVPKDLRNAGYKEVSAMRLGRGIWSFRLERYLPPMEISTTAQPSKRTEKFQEFMDSLKTSPRKVTKLSLDYATRR